MSTESLSQEANAAACLIQIEDTVLMIRHRLTGRLDFPAGGVSNDESLRCTAHRETWEETGFNVEVGELLTYSSSGMPIFHCRGDNNLAALSVNIEPPDWSSLEVTQLERVRPFDISADALRFKDDIIPLRDAFVAAQKASNSQ